MIVSMKFAMARRHGLVMPMVRTLTSSPHENVVRNPVCDLQDLQFQLFDVLKVQEDLFNENFPRYKHHTMDFVKDALQSAEVLATEAFAPHNRKNDLQEPRFDGKKVAIIPEVKDALTRFNENGFISAHADEEFGGMQLPTTVTNAMMMPFYSANIGTATFPFLTIAAGNMLRKYGNEQQLQRFLRPMLEGRFTGTVSFIATMLLLETNANIKLNLLL